MQVLRAKRYTSSQGRAIRLLKAIAGGADRDKMAEKVKSSMYMHVCGSTAVVPSQPCMRIFMQGFEAELLLVVNMCIAPSLSETRFPEQSKAARAHSEDRLPP